MTSDKILTHTIKILSSDGNLINNFCFNEFTEEIEFNEPPVWSNKSKINSNINDMHITEMRVYLGKVHNFEPNKSICAEAMYIVSKQNKSYHPIKEFIEKEKWDGQLRLDEWIIKCTGCEDNYYTRMVSSKFLIAAVNRVYNPGCKFDHMIVLEGPQGIYKSTMIEILSDKWYLDTSFENKTNDLVDSINNALIVEISELGGMNKKEVEWLRSFLSKKFDRIRLPYDRRVRDFKRKCVFIGTHNPSGNNTYLRDDTGNRRYWPIECKSKKIDCVYLKDNLHQLWAEAFNRYKLGEQYYIDNPEALKILSGLHIERELLSPTETKIRKYLIYKTEVLMSDLIQDCLKINMDGKMPRDLLGVSTTIGIIMKKLNWVKGKGEDRDKYKLGE